MKKKLLKFFIIIGALAVLLTIISTTQVQAVLQSNPNTHCKKYAELENWMAPFRNMEAIGGALGLSEIINTNTLKATKSNNLDSHMMKSTEYGAIAILSVSGYGNSKKIHESTIKTTTGNETGLYFTGSEGEYVAAGVSGIAYLGKDSRYYDAYTISQESAKRGDAIGTANITNQGCSGWHNSNRGWISNGAPYLQRDYYNIFAFAAYKNSAGNANKLSSRGVVVCGEGL